MLANVYFPPVMAGEHAGALAVQFCSRGAPIPISETSSALTAVDAGSAGSYTVSDRCHRAWP